MPRASMTRPQLHVHRVLAFVLAVAFATLAAATAGAGSFHMGTAGSLALPQGGDICLGFNDVCGTYGDNSGSFSVTLSLTRGGNTIFGPQVFTVNAADYPCVPTFTGAPGGNLADKCTGWATQAGDVLSWTASGTCFRAPGAGTDPAGIQSVSNNQYLVNAPGSAFDLVGSVGGWTEDHDATRCQASGCGATSTQAWTWGTLKLIYR